MHSSVHSASSHTGSVQITISFWGLFGCDISEFRFHSIADDPISSTGQSSQITQFCIYYIPNHLECIGSVNGSFCHVIRARNDLNIAAFGCGGIDGKLGGLTP